MNSEPPFGTVRHASDLPADGRAFAQFAVERRIAGPGDIRLRNRIATEPDLPDILTRFAHWAASHPDRVLLSEPAEGGAAALSYGEAQLQAGSLAGKFAARGLVPGDRVAVVLRAGRAHALLKLACLHAGLVHVPLSPQLRATPSGREKLAAMLADAAPSLIVAEAGALDALPPALAVTPAALFGAAGAATPAPCPAAAHDVAAVYFTSGSTGSPKGVLVTRGMISAVQAGIRTHWPFLGGHPPVMADWLPWHHVFGGLDNFFKMIWNGGTYHVSPVPTPETMPATARRIAALRPTVHVDVPFGIALLLDQFEARPDLLSAFLERLELIFFAGAGMDSATWTRLNRAVQTRRTDAPSDLRLASGYGSTETGSTICLGHEPAASPGEIGVPLPGTELRLFDRDGRMELRVRGPNVSPGYLRRGKARPMPLDDEGFLETGDTVQPVRPDHPEMGLSFDGRIAEDFKLSSGTRVKVGALRHALLSACAPWLTDVAIAGEGRDRLGALLFPSPSALALDPAQRERLLRRALEDHNARWPSNSMAVRRALILDTAPDPGRGEVNDKGHLVQRRCLANRAEDIDRLYARTPPPGVITLEMPPRPDFV